MAARLTSCPVCGAPVPAAFFEAPDVPVHCNVLCDTPEAARAAPRADLRLVFCPGCCLIYNDAFDPGRMAYVQGYENSLHVSDVFQDYARGLAEGLVQRHGLQGRQIVEIGCGGGEFLELLCELGDNQGLGFDPSHAGLPPPDGRVRILAEGYGPSHARAPADLVCCRQVLEHIQRPLELLALVASQLRARPGSVTCFEVPDGLYTLRLGGIWDLIYEHCSYFTEASLRSAFERAGLRPLRAEGVYGGQFLVLEAAAGDEPGPGAGAVPDAARAELAGLVQAFAHTYREKAAHWRAHLDGLRAAGRRAAVWGAGSKGVTFLNVLRADAGTVAWVVDVNPHKQGRAVPGTGQRIVAPQALAADPPDEVIVMNPLYRDEIRAILAQLGLQPELVSA